jgi:hypothetical protein
MNCNEALELMLEADPDELAGKGSSVVAAHVRTCAKCGAVAARLLADTSALATALEARSAIARRAPALRTRILRPVAVAGTLAAAMVLMVLWRTRRSEAPKATASVELPVSAPVSAKTSAPLFAPASRAPTAGDSATALPQRSASPAASRRFADAAPVVAMPVAATSVSRSAPASTELAALSVDPPPGTRAAVLHTRNPAITVVWLY